MADLGATHDKGGSIGGTSSGPTSLAAGALKLPEVTVRPFAYREGQPVMPIDRTWLSMSLKETPSGITGTCSYKQELFEPKAYPDLPAVRQKWAEVETEQVEFIDRVAIERLEQLMPVRTTEMKLIYLLQHVANHSTYHRGQIGLMMRQLGAVPLATDFHVFVMDRR